MASKKPKRDESVAGSSSKTEQCIIHCRDTLSGPLKALTKERLSKLKERKKILRLSEPATIRPKLAQQWRKSADHGRDSQYQSDGGILSGYYCSSVFFL